MTKQWWEESEKKREEERRHEKRKNQKTEDASARKGRKVFLSICDSGGSKSKLAKAAGAEPSGQMREEKLHVIMYKTCQPQATFGSWDVAKVHAVVGRSIFGSQNVQTTPFSDRFWKLRCRKSVRRCGAKHIPKSTCTKHTSFEAFLEVEMSKKCTPLWPEAHFEVKSAKLPVPDHFWTFRCRLVRQVQAHCQKWAKREGFVAASTTTTTTLHSTPLHCTTLHCNHNYSYNYNYNYITLRYASLQYTNYIALHYTPLQYTTLQYTNYNYNHNYYYITLH